MNLNIIFIFLLFLLGIYFIVKSVTYERELFETFQNNIDQTECPDLLIEEDNKIKLYYSKKTLIPGVNPIIFNNLEEYVEFLNFQRSKGIYCPILKLKKMNTAQGEQMYQIKTSTSINNPGEQTNIPKVQTTPPVQKMIDATRDDPPYNDNSYPGYDSDNQNIGKSIPIDNL